MKKHLFRMAAIIVTCLVLCSCGKSPAATNVESLIGALGEVSLETEKAIEEAEEAYNKLSEDEKASVNNIDILEDARKELDQQIEKKKADDEAAKKQAEEAAAEEEKQKRVEAYRACVDNIIATGTQRVDDTFSGVEYVFPVDPANDTGFRGSVAATEGSDDIWIFYDYNGSDSAVQEMRWSIDINGKTGVYRINLPIALDNETHIAFVDGSFDVETYRSSGEFLADEITFEEKAFEKEGLQADTSQLESHLKSYPEQVVPVSIEGLKYWLENNGLNITLEDLGFGINKETVNNNSGSSGGSSGGNSGGSSGGSRTCPNCNGSKMVKTYATNDPWEEPTYIECPMCHGTGKVSN